MEFIFLYIFPYSFIAMGIAGVWTGIRQFSLARESCDWPSVKGVIAESKVLRSSDGEGGIGFYPTIEYDYEVCGEMHQSSQVAFGEVTSGRRDYAERLVSKYPAGSSVEVYFDPSNHKASVLEHRPQAGVSIFTGVGLLFIAAGIALVFLMPIFFRLTDSGA